MPNYDPIVAHALGLDAGVPDQAESKTAPGMDPVVADALGSYALHASLNAASTANPEEEAKKHKLAKSLGTDPYLVPAHSEAMAEIFRRTHSPEEILKANPKTGRLLENPKMAAIGRDDISAMQDLENTLNSFTPAKIAGAAAGGIVRQVNVPAFGLLRAASDLINLPESVSGYFADKQHQAELVAKTFEPDTGEAGPIERGTYSGVSSAAGMVPALVGGALTIGPRVAANVSSFATRMASFVTNYMGASTAATEYGTARDEGVNKFASAVYALAQGGVEKVTEMLPQATFLKGLTGETGLKKALANYAWQDVGGEQIATVWQDFNNWMVVNPTKTVDDFMAERPAAAVETFAATIVAGLLQSSAAHPSIRKHFTDGQRAQETETGAAALQKMSEIASAMKMRELDTETFHEAVTHLTDNTNLKEVYVDAGKMAEVFKQSPELIPNLPEVNSQMAEALATKGDVRISTADYLTHIAGTPAEASILPALRVDPNGPTVDESKAYMQTAKDELAKHVEALTATEEPVLTRQEFEAQQQAEIDLKKPPPVERRAAPERRLRPAEIADYTQTTPADMAAAIANAENIRAEGDKLITRGADRRSADRRVDNQTRAVLDEARASGEFTDKQVEELSKLTRNPPREAKQQRLDIKEKIILAATPEEKQALEAQLAPLDKIINEHKAKVNTLLEEGRVKATKAREEKKAKAYDEYLKGHSNQAAVYAKDVSEVHDKILKSFMDTKRYTRAVAEVNTIAIRKVYETAAKRMGMKPSEVYALKPVTFQARAAGGLEQLAGLPEKVMVDGVEHTFSSFAPAREAAKAYMAKAGLPYHPVQQYVKVDQARAARIADEFEKMKHDPENPEVKAAYAALVKETLAQWETIKATGLKVEFITGKDPYGNPRNAIKDIVENNHLWVFPTSSGFGDGTPAKELAGMVEKQFKAEGNPLLAIVPNEEISGRFVQVNDIFRIVHDYFGHAKEGVGFRADGEENAWRIHSTMFSPLARKALTTETRGQNSWLNFGPYGEKNRTAKPEETRFADQKTGLLPDWVVNEGSQDSVSVIGVRFSKQPRETLSGEFSGAGIAGEEAKRLKYAEDKRIKTRLNFYVDEGQGVFPEAGVGKNRAEVPLTNMYDAAKNPLGLPSKDKNEFESAVLNAGFNGYYVRAGFHKQGVAVLLGDHATSVVVPKKIEHKGEYQQFAGPISLGADHYALANAKERLAAGEDPEVVRKNTGWFVNPHDNMWRYEIDDSDAKVAMENIQNFGAWFSSAQAKASPNNVQLGGLLEHPALYAAYPMAATIRLKVLPMGLAVGGGRGAYDATSHTMYLSAALRGDEVLSTTMHEVQHAIQSVEGFGSGGTMDSAREVLLSKQQERHDAAMDRLVKLGEKLPLVNHTSRVMQAFDSALKARYGIVEYDNAGYYLPESDGELMRAVSEDDRAERKERAEAYYKALEDAGGWDNPDVQEFVKATMGVYYARPRAVTDAEAFQAYQNISGEIEARETQARLTFTEAQRAAAPPEFKRTGDVIVVFNGKAMAHAAQPANVGVSGLGFYSALGRAVLGAKQTTASANDWKAIIAKMPGVKKEEIEASGIMDWLDVLHAQGDKAVPKQTITSYLDSHGLELREIELAVVTQDERAVADRAGEMGYSWWEEQETNFVDNFESQLDHSIVEHENDDGEITYIVSEDISSKEFKTEEDAQRAIDEAVDREQRDAWIDYRDGLEPPDFTDEAREDLYPEGEGDAKFSEYRVFESEGSNYREMLLTLPGGISPADFHGGHWDESNVAAHYRISDGPNGELLVEEIQSDWAQEGRKRGFAGDPAADEKRRAAKENVDRAEKERDAAYELFLGMKPRVADALGLADDAMVPDAVLEDRLRRAGHAALADEFQAKKAEWDAAANAYATAAEAYRVSARVSAPVPRAPFVTDTKAWTALTVKRILRYAAENGYTSIVFPTGKMQVDLYSNALRKRVDTITWVKTPEGIRISGWQNGGNVVDTTQSETTLSDAIGKVMADKIISDPNQSGEITGDDITIDNTGMAGFYDRLLPPIVNRISKSVGGGEATRESIRGPSTAEYHKSNLRVTQPRVLNGLYGVFGRMGREEMLAGPFDTAEEAYAAFPEVVAKETAKLRAKEDAKREKLLTLAITPEMRGRIMQGLPLFQGERGTFNPGSLVIGFTQGANLSTPVHETGHLYLELLTGLSEMESAPKDIVDDVNKVMNWFGVTREQWKTMSLEEKRPFHEQWAESFERYALEGVAPSAELRPVFARFAAWLTQVYKSVKEFVRLHPAAGKLNDEIRGVFDRMLASQEAIAEAETLRSYAPLFPSATEAKIDEAKFKAYVNIGQDATDAAVVDMQQASLRDMKWLSNAKSKKLKELQAKANTQRAKIRAEVEAEVRREPTYQAIGELRKKDSGLKLHTGILKEMFPMLDVTELRGMTSTENGTHPDQLAQLFGFSGGEVLVNHILAAEDMDAKIDGLTDQRMLEEHGEMIDARAIEQAANGAIHNEARAKFLATGLKILGMKSNKDSPISATALAKAAKETAENAIAGKRVRDLRPAQYEAAESRSNKEALKLAAKKPLEAITAQRAALLNNRLAKAAYDAQDKVEKHLRYAKKFVEEGTRANIDLEFLEQIDALLAPFDFKTNTTLTEIERRKSLADWIAKQEAAGFEPAIDQEQMEKSKLKSYKEMTVSELDGLVDAIKQIEHLGRLKKKLLTAKDAREFAERVNEAKDSIIANTKRRAKDRGTPTDIAGMAGQWARSMAAEHRKFASIIREMDGGKDNGVMANLLLYSMNEAGNKEVEMRADAAVAMAKIFEPVLTKIGKDGRIVSRKRQVPGTGLSMTTEQRLMFALNWGNAGNRQRLLDGGMAGARSLTQAQAERVLGTLTRQEWDFVQSVWDYVGSFRDQIAAQERKLTGVEPQWVEATPIEVTINGEKLRYRGGYFPAKYDAMLSTRSESLEAVTDLRQSMKGAFNASATRSGYTKKRSDEVHGRPLLLSFNAISQHVSEVTHRLAWQEWLTDANRVVRALDSTVRETYGPEIATAMRNTIKDIAEGDAPSRTPVERAINHLRTGSTIVGMGWRVTTALMQPSGLAQSWVRIGGKWVAKGVGRYLANPLEQGKFVDEKSSFMRHRAATLAREINEVLNTVRAGKKISAIEASHFTLIGKMQRVVDMPTWLGAYEKALAELKYENSTDENSRKGIESKAVELADQAVLDSQGGGTIKDLAGVQRGSPAMKLFTNFYSYFNTTYQLNVEAFRRTNFKSPTEFGMFAVDMLMLNTVPMLFSVALKELLKGDCEWDMECITNRLKSEQLSYLFGQMILLREVGSAASAATGDSFQYTGPAGLRFFSDMYKLGQQAGQGDADMALFKAANTVGGALLHYPAGQVNTTVEGIMAVENGEVDGVNVFSALIAGPRR